jgi:hypothetical protein
MTHSDQAAQFDQTEMRELNTDELELVTGGMLDVRGMLEEAMKKGGPVLFGNKSANKKR